MNDSEGSDSSFDTYILTSNTGGRCEWEISNDQLTSYVSGLRGTFNGQNRTGDNNSGTDTGGEIAYSDTTRGNWAANNAELLVRCNKRVTEIDERIGVPTRLGTRGMVRGTPPGLYVDTVPSSNTTNGFLPYGRTLYNECNYILGSDLNLLGNLIKDIQSLGDLIDIVKKARNRYEMYNGRDKEYTDV